MPICSVPWCKNSNYRGHSLHRIPKDKETAGKWVEFLKNEGVSVIPKNSMICDSHFKVDENGFKSEVPCIINDVRILTINVYI
jgi:hypothetical protein